MFPRYMGTITSGTVSGRLTNNPTFERNDPAHCGSREEVSEWSYKINNPLEPIGWARFVFREGLRAPGTISFLAMTKNTEHLTVEKGRELGRTIFILLK